MLGPCPHCGKEDHVYTSNRAYGWAERSYDLDGYHTETSMERVALAPSKTIRCASCQKVRRDLTFENVTEVIRRRP